MAINYNDIVELFPKTEWDFSYLTFNEIQETLNHPIKYFNTIEKFTFEGYDIPLDTIFLVVVKYTEDFDYSLTTIFNNICKQYLPELKFDEFWCNYKYAVVQSGLGMFAKNSLIYTNKFGFESHCMVFSIYNTIINLPERKPANFNLLNFCENCDDCIQSCPVQAIHYNHGHTWVDMYACDNFCQFGNHPYIPSVKWNRLKLSPFNLTDKEIIQINNFQDKMNLYPDLDFSSDIEENGKVYTYIFPICRECTSQIKCSKYKGHYSYNWNNVKKIPII